MDYAAQDDTHKLSSLVEAAGGAVAAGFGTGVVGLATSMDYHATAAGFKDAKAFKIARDEITKIST